MKPKTIKRKAEEFEDQVKAALPPKRMTGNNFIPGQAFSPGIYSPIRKGHTLSRKENMAPEAHARRMKGLLQTWHNQKLRRMGENVVHHTVKKKASVTKRLRKRERAAMEHRQVQEESRKSAADVLEMLKTVVNNPGERTADRIAAGQVLMDRAYGKANQTNTNVNVDANGKPTEVSAKELKDRIDHTIKRIEELTGGAPEARPSQERSADLRKRDGDTGGSTLH